MGVNLALLVFGRPPQPGLGAGNGASAELLHELFPRTRHRRTGSASLIEMGIPERGTIGVAQFGGGLLVATRDAALYNPSMLHRRYLKPSLGRTVVLLTQRSATDMVAFARWQDATLSRSISVNPIGRVWESLGPEEKWERPFWDGLRPVEVGYPLPFHPLELGEEAMRSVLGLWCEGSPAPGLVDAADVVLEIYER